MINNVNDSPVKNKKELHLRELFHNNKFVLVFSLVVAFSLWVWVSVEKSPVIQNVIVSVPVVLDAENSVPSQLGLQVFGNDKYTVDVTVSGKKFIVSSLTAEDIKVTAQTNYVDSAGEKSLSLKAVSNSSKDFEIVALSQNYISVYFDTYKQTEFALTPNIISPDNKYVVDDCILGNIVFSKSTLTISGPSTEVNKIKSVNATYTLTDPLSATTTVIPKIELVGVASSQLPNIKINLDENDITMTLPVLKEVVLPTTVSFKNAPASYLNGNINKSVSPSSVKVAIPVEKIDEITEISIGTIDFSDLNTGYNTFVFKKDDITDYTITDNIKSFKATINMSGMSVVNVSIPASNIIITSQVDGYKTTVSTKAISNVKIIGPEDFINNLDPSLVIAEIDLTNVDVSEGTLTVPVAISVKGNTSCWANGNYTAVITSVVS